MERTVCYASLLLNCSDKAAKPDPAVVLSIADCCFVGRGDDDDNDNELAILRDSSWIAVFVIVYNKSKQQYFDCIVILRLCF